MSCLSTCFSFVQSFFSDECSKAISDCLFPPEYTDSYIDSTPGICIHKVSKKIHPKTVQDNKMLSESSKQEYLMKINKIHDDFNIVREGDYENIFKLKFGHKGKTIVPWKNREE